MSILIKPIITEKMTVQGEKLNQYAFIVDRKANKIEIASAVKELYNVSPVSVNTMVYRGKTKNRYTKGGIIFGRTSSFKKAVITLEKGVKIDFFSNI